MPTVPLGYVRRIGSSANVVGVVAMTVPVVTVGVVTVGVVTVGVVIVGGRVGRAFSAGFGDGGRRRCGDGGLDRFFGLGLDRDLLSTTPRM